MRDINSDIGNRNSWFSLHVAGSLLVFSEEPGVA